MGFSQKLKQVFSSKSDTSSAQSVGKGPLQSNVSNGQTTTELREVPDIDNWTKARDLTKAAEVKELESRKKAKLAQNTLHEIKSHHEKANAAYSKEKELSAQAKAKLENAGDVTAAEGELKKHHEHLQNKALAAQAADKNLIVSRTAVNQSMEQIKMIEPKVAKAKEDIVLYEKQAAESHRKRVVTESHHQEVVAKAGSMQAAHDNKTRQLAAVDAEASNLAALIAQYELKLKEARAQYNSAGLRLDDMRKEHTESQKQLEAFSSQPDEIAKMVAAHGAAEQECLSNLEQTKALLNTSQQDAELHRGNLAARQKQLQEHSSAADVAIKERESAVDVVKASEARLGEVRKQRLAAEAEHAKLSQEAELHRREGAALEAKLAATTQTYKAQKAEAEKLHMSATEFWSKAKSIVNEEHNIGASLLHTLEEKLGIKSALASEA